MATTSAMTPPKTIPPSPLLVVSSISSIYQENLQSLLHPRTALLALPLQTVPNAVSALNLSPKGAPSHHPKSSRPSPIDLTKLARSFKRSTTKPLWMPSHLALHVILSLLRRPLPPWRAKKTTPSSTRMPIPMSPRSRRGQPTPPHHLACRAEVAAVLASATASRVREIE